LSFHLPAVDSDFIIGSTFPTRTPLYNLRACRYSGAMPAITMHVRQS